MGVELRVTNTVWDNIMRRMAGLGLDPNEFWKWKSDAEFSLERNRGDLHRVTARSEVFHEFAPPPVEVGTRKFKLTWEINVDKGADLLEVLDLRIFETRPRLI